MLGFPEGTKNEQKCSVTHGVMGHLDPKQPPTKRKPFAAILDHHFVQKVELLLPQEIYEIIKTDFLEAAVKPAYSRVILPLKALVEGEFFNEYIKRGNVLMLSEGISGVDNVYTLREDKESYERAGLVGKPEGVKGKRGTKPRWIVEINLRLPSMLHGKKGFDRIVYAFKNVLTTPVTWLFHDLGTTAVIPEPLDAHFPIKKSASFKIQEHINVSMPTLKPPPEIDETYGFDFEDFATELHEWLALVLLESPRVKSDDKIDPFISRYVPPGDSMSSATLVKVTWQGLLTPLWAHRKFVDVLLSIPRESWFAYSVVSFGEGWTGGSKNCTILRVPDAPNEYVLWEIA
ncbi:hypothetical protein G7Y89_g7002 [Cudoniella acicularis]|uniref:Uncharacterized protein n=1 Tax=Cudoniella acicularis TaxID=354080 RepID=A0A8H4RJE7_9HELO|nr:hypothetical protein G7Y89_g7002 [Cudoniella acicularis]